MKKETVHKFLGTLARQARANKDQLLQIVMLEAIHTCRRWLELPWAEMQKPVLEKLNDLKQEAYLLSHKRKSQMLTTEEQTRLTQIELMCEKIYIPFNQKITPTVRRAQVNRKK